MPDELRPNLFPALRYADADAALAFLTSAFGFVEKDVHRGEDGSVVHAELRLGVGIIMLGQYSEAGRSSGQPPNPLSGTYDPYA